MQVKSNYTQKLVLGLCVYARGRVPERERKKWEKKVIYVFPFRGSSCSNRCHGWVPLGSSPAIMRYNYLTAPSWRSTDTESTV